MRLLPPLLLAALLLPRAALADQNGKTGASTTGCGSCHGASADATTSVAFSTSSTTVNAGSRVLVRLTVTTTNAAHTYAGLDVSATGGTLAAGSNTKLSRSEVTHSAPVAMSASSTAFEFYWTAPSTAGAYSLRGAGNAVNHNGASSGDGWNLAPNLSMTVCVDVDADGVTSCESDCDDTTASTYPGAPELCNGVDDDCNGVDDDSPVDGTTYFPDDDADGYGTGTHGTTVCTAPDGYSPETGDCDDTDAAVNPSAIEVCDSGRVDEDCNDLADDEDPSVTGTTDYYADLDLDDHGDPSELLTACHPPVESVDAAGDADDCDDEDATTYPGAEEVCDEVDHNCDGIRGGFDEDVDGWTTCFDCDDLDASVNPAGIEVCDGVDDDCSGVVDGADALGAQSWYPDGDHDGYGPDGTGEISCAAPSGWVSLDGDCGDDTTAAHPGATEVCDGTDVDEDCDGLRDDADPSVTGQLAWYVDEDGDGYGVSASAVVTCEAVADYTTVGGDCDDTNAALTTDTTETCNGVDDDCDLLVDEGYTTGWYTDADGDGFGGEASLLVTCSPDSTVIAVGGDCDDEDAYTYPDAPDAWYDGHDNNCDGAEDFDADADGHESESWGGDDCDDSDPAVYLGAPDVSYDGVSTDCTFTDELDHDLDGYLYDVDCDDANAAFHPDAAEDCSSTMDYNCDGAIGARDEDLDGYNACTDCDDSDSATNPDAVEVCNDIDDDCDEDVDEDLAASVAWPDADSDGYGDATATPSRDCALPRGYVTNDHDCDDSDPERAKDCTVDPGDTADTGDTSETGETNETGDTGDTNETGDTSDTNETGDTDLPEETGDTDLPDETGDTGAALDKTGCGCATEPERGTGLAWTAGVLGALFLGRRRARS